MHQEEEKYPEIRNKLLSLPKVKASEDFMMKLQHKINLADAEEKSAKIKANTAGESKKKFFGFSGWLVPSLSFGAVAGIAFFVVYIGFIKTAKENTGIDNVASTQEKSNSEITKSEDKVPGTMVPDQIIAGDLKQDKPDFSAPPVSPETRFSTDRMLAEPPKVMDMLTPKPSLTEPKDERLKVIESEKKESEEVMRKDEGKDVLKKSGQKILKEEKGVPLPSFPPAKKEDKKTDNESGKIDNVISPFVNPSDKPAQKEEGTVGQDKKKSNKDNKQDNKQENKQENNQENKKEDKIKQQKDTTDNKKKDKQQETIKEIPKQEIPKTEVPKNVPPKQETKNKQEQNKNND